MVEDDQPEVAGFVQQPTIAAVAMMAAVGKMIACYEPGPLECQADAKEQQAGQLDLNPRQCLSSTRRRL